MAEGRGAALSLTSHEKKVLAALEDDLRGFSPALRAFLYVFPVGLVVRGRRRGRSALDGAARGFRPHPADRLHHL